MREYLFRGKMIANGNWSEGTLLVTKQGCCITPDATVYVAVDPETVGQYTGYKDKNGKKIFEGDIVKRINCLDEVTYGRVQYDESKTGFELVSSYCSSRLSRPHYIKTNEVVGNIYDNPELLGDEDNDKKRGR